MSLLKPQYKYRLGVPIHSWRRAYHSWFWTVSFFFLIVDHIIIFTVWTNCNVLNLHFKPAQTSNQNSTYPKEMTSIKSELVLDVLYFICSYSKIKNSPKVCALMFTSMVKIKESMFTVLWQSQWCTWLLNSLAKSMLSTNTCMPNRQYLSLGPWATVGLKISMIGAR